MVLTLMKPTGWLYWMDMKRDSFKLAVGSYQLKTQNSLNGGSNLLKLLPTANCQLPTANYLLSAGNSRLADQLFDFCFEFVFVVAAEA
jgi:hypothetical protein